MGRGRATIEEIAKDHADWIAEVSELANHAYLIIVYGQQFKTDHYPYNFGGVAARAPAQRAVLRRKHVSRHVSRAGGRAVGEV